MLYAALIVSEVIFWVLLLGALAIRYGPGWRRTSTVVLYAIVVNELGLLALAAWDLRRSGQASIDHVVTAAAFGYIVVYAPRDLREADKWIQHKLAGKAEPGTGSQPAKTKLTEQAHARAERRGWYRHAAMCAVGVGLMLLGILAAGSLDAGHTLVVAAELWIAILALDAVISFSYTLWPRKPARQDHPEP